MASPLESGLLEEAVQRAAWDIITRLAGACLANLVGVHADVSVAAIAGERHKDVKRVAELASKAS